MLAQFIRKEILDSLLNRRFMALALFSVVLMPLSAVINYEYFQTRRASFDSQYAEFQETKNPSDVRGYRPPELLSVLARGTEPYMPLYYLFGTTGSDMGETRPGNIEAEDFRLLAALGSIDFLFLVQVVFSLLAILLSFDMVAGEKERGTLKAVLANPVPRDSILLGKLIGGFLVLLLVFVIGFLLLYLTLALFDGRFLSPAMMGSMAFIVAVSIIFLAGFYSLGLMVSSFCHSSRTAIVALLVVWVLLQLVIPKAGEMFAKVVRPVRSEEAVRVEKNKVLTDLQDRQMDRGGEIFQRIFGTDQLNSRLIYEETPQSEQFRLEYKEVVEDLWQEQNTRMRDIDQSYAREQMAQRQLAASLSLLSPSAAFGFLVSDAAGTGDLAYEQYLKDVGDFYSVLNRTVLSQVRDSQIKVSIGGSSFWMSGDEGPEWTEVPEFSVTSLGLAEIIQANIWALASLLAYLILPFLVAYVAFLRYDVR